MVNLPVSPCIIDQRILNRPPRNPLKTQLMCEESTRAIDIETKVVGGGPILAFGRHQPQSQPGEDGSGHAIQNDLRTPGLAQAFSEKSGEPGN